MGGSGGGTTSIQDIPKEFKPGFTSLFNSAFGAARTAAGQPGFGTQGPPGGATNIANFITGLGQTGGNPFAPPGSPFQNPFSSQFQQPTNNIFAGPQSLPQSPQSDGAFGSKLNPQQQNTGQQQVSQQQAISDPLGNTAQFQNQNDGAFGSKLNPQQSSEIGPNAEFPQNLQEGTVGSTNSGKQSTKIPLASGPPIVGQPFGEQFTAGTSPLEFESLAQREAIARQLQGIGNPLLNLGNFTAQGGFLDPRSNPFLVSNIEASLRPITQEFSNSVLPNFNSQAIQSGAFGGSSARDLAFNQLASGFGQQLLDTGTGIAFNNFQNERQLQQNAGSLLDQGALLNQLTPEMLAQVGLGQRELAQRPLDEALLQFQESINAPFRPLFPLASILQGGDIGSSFSTTVPQPSALSSGIIGALGGAGAGAGIGSSLGLEQGGTGLSSAIGALLGGLGGGLG